ncbi:olfactory receptor class A-like protein 4 [Thalassophryne amazonica]|uniref:olfactory receptor class A-like protein 4 n=1 Tax=Thalassophryne amazonica TaxID=390379 RepID=UPI001471CE4A|nr:olfactory receptor class A-like protein 4 [Thalassophryne amazonica]
MQLGSEDAVRQSGYSSSVRMQLASQDAVSQLAAAKKRLNMEEDKDTKLVGMGLRASVSPVQTALYIILVLLGIVGNAIIVGVIGQSVIKEGSGGHKSDIIIINIGLSNLLVLLLRNTLLVISDLGLELYSSKEWCQVLMGIWVWLRSVNNWSTLFLSAFHLQTLRRVTPIAQNLHGAPTDILLALGLIWLLTFIYSIPAHVFSTNGNVNSTETLMLVSSTTRPLLGCVWNFPSSFSGLAYAASSMVIHETIPIILMVFTSLSSLYTLYKYGRMQQVAVIKQVPAERRAAKVILALIMLSVTSWGTSIISVNCFNYNYGSSDEFLLVISRFSNIIFIAMSPLVLAVGHRRLRSFIKSLL